MCGNLSLAAEKDLKHYHETEKTIRKFEVVIERNREKLKNESMDDDTREELVESMEICEQYLCELKRRKHIPLNVITTGSSVAGGVIGALLGAVSGYWAGTQTGAVIVSGLGLVGVVIGAAAGAVVGTVAGAFAGAVGGSAGAGIVAEFGLQKMVGQDVEFKEVDYNLQKNGEAEDLYELDNDEFDLKQHKNQ